jgi:hypothetical protein
VAQVGEHLCSKQEVLNSKPELPKKKKKKKGVILQMGEFDQRTLKNFKT